MAFHSPAHGLVAGVLLVDDRDVPAWSLTFCWKGLGDAKPEMRTAVLLKSYLLANLLISLCWNRLATQPIIPKGLRVLFLSGLFSFLKHPVFHFHRKSFGIGVFPSLNKPSEETEMLGGRPWNNAMSMAAHSTGSVTVTSLMKVTM